ncbi:hypothetical protein Sste5346_004102 [Sporothrix stenoceras]|uniref:Uncharacterized protein n=1 Tax=Sporothrix stenoceras TaxID=5173 RepID=A0ABR3Z9M4_9PEZI
MAATRIEGHKPLPRSESLQKMLDLEKQYKLARLQRTQTSPTPDASAMSSFQPQIWPPVPIQTRRRDSRESLYQQHQQHQQHQQQLDQITTAVRRSGPASPLSITIPSPTDAGEKGQLSQKSHRPSTRNMAADSDAKPASEENSGDTTPREMSVEFSTQTKNGTHFEDDDDEGSESDQSSICQSPSWEGYGQKKKSKEKKLKAEMKRKEKERMDQELRAASKKRASNRLYKSPPLDSPDLNGHRPSSSASSRLNSSHGLGTKSGRFTPSSNQGLIPEVWGMAMGSSLSIPKSRPGYPRSQSAAGSYNDQDASRGPAVTMAQIQQQNASGNKKSTTTSEDRPTSSSDKVSYPPTSSRSHGLRSILPTSHSRQNSASTITPVPSKPEDLPTSTNNNSNGNRLYLTKNVSDQSLNHTSEKAERGRQLVDPAGSGSGSGSGGGSYVRKARAQSIERSIKGFMQEAALSDPNLLNGPNRTQFAYLGAPQQHQQQSNGDRPSSSQSKITKPFGASNGVNGVNGTATAVDQQNKKSQQQPQQPSRPQQQHPLKQHQPPKQAAPQKQQQDASPPVSDKTKTQSPEKDGESNTDYINFVSKPYSPPSLELATPTSGIFSSIKSRIGRRSSTSSGSTSNTNNTGRSFKERAMGAIYSQAHSNINSVAVVIPISQPPSRKHSQNSAQTTAASSIVSSTKNEASSSASSSGSTSLQIPQRDIRRLPKPARVLGEINQETMSQGPPARSRPSEGSSTSSYHDDSSIPPSPASTPDTSRPQSAKGLSATIEEIQIGSPGMFKASQEDLTMTTPQNSEQTQTTTTKEAQTQDTLPNRPASRTESVRDVTVDRPQSKGRLLDDLERPISRGRLLENIERPGSRTRVREEPRQTRPNGHTEQPITETHDEDIMLDSTPNLSEGLGILDEAWSQSTVTPDNDAQSFVTTLTNQKSGTSLKSQFGNLKEAALLAEAQNSLGVHPALINHEHEPAPPAYNHTLQEVDESEFLDGNNGVEEQLQPSPEKTLQRNSFRKAEKRTSKQAKHMSVVNEEPRLADDGGHHNQRASSPTPVGSDPRKTSTDVSFLPPLRHEAFIPPKSKARNSAPPTKHVDHEAQLTSQQDTAALASPVPTTATTAAPEQAAPPSSASGRSSPSAMYLQEARRSAPLVSSPLSNVIRSAKANMSTPSLTRPPLKTSASFSSGQHLAHTGTTFLPLPPTTTTSSGSSGKSPTSPRFRIPAHEPEQLAKQTPQSKPMAKMLVECCNCKFFHDMPSRVYECMAQPDAVVTDRDLGVSGAITTMVKCPWCSHNMSTQCCAGYAAVVYLKERLH